MSAALSRAQFGRVARLAGRAVDSAYDLADRAIAPVADPLWRALASRVLPQETKEAR